jgi:Rieske Fe-S protein
MSSTETDLAGPGAAGAAPECPGEAGHVCRRAMLASAGAVGVGLALTGCGAAGQAAGKAGDAVTSAAQQAISKVSIPVGGGRVFADQKVVVTQPTSGDFKAFSAVCTHQGCIVSDVSNGTINCLCHGSQFDIATGDVKAGPATQPLPAKGVTVSSNGITVT